ncbi:copper homeostasis protein CutC [Nocardioides sp. cx-169]|uniref:copper homeostasis protein CutC n=1 Tax=Nocardioides sp. cx-169 TaxID=2899080 RepID=UPI001E647778|nr:copper homeostasis protein CutC [Nocardioides sp. cx-169]MCD4536163.1 copper homeostasis protein CutC [Nocardioides sp. cx-169]
MSRGLLEVAVLHARDVPGCERGGADRLSLAVEGEGEGRTPDLATAASVIRATALPVRVMLRLNDTLTTTGGEFVRLVGLGEELVSLGAEGVEFGFLDADLEVDVETCRALASALPGVPWTFHRGIDRVLEPARSWRHLTAGLPGLSAVRSGGSPQGLTHGYDDLLALAEADPDVARLLMPAGGLLPEHVPWLLRAGVRQLHVDVQVRPGATTRSYVDADFVRSWRLILDDAASRSA